MQLLIVFFSVSILFSFLCSIWEAVLLSIPPSFVAAREKEGTRIGKRLSRFKADIDRPLAAILTLNTIAHTVGAIGVGAQAAKVLSHSTLLGLNVAAVIVPALMTLAILILSEIIPKTLGASYWRLLTPFTVASLNVIGLLLFPLVWVSQLITRSLKKGAHTSVLSRSEFSAIAEVVAEQGALEKEEYRFIKNLLHFNSICAQDVMTPRTVLIAADQEQTVGEHYASRPDLKLSRIPIYEKTIDTITGFVARRDVLTAMVQGRESALLKDLRRNILMVRLDDTLPDIFTALLESRTHMAAVVDAYGGTAGILTMEDVVETLLGLEIVDEFDQTEDMQQLARKNWQKRAIRLGLIRDDHKPTDNPDANKKPLSETSTTPPSDTSEHAQ